MGCVTSRSNASKGADANSHINLRGRDLPLVVFSSVRFLNAHLAEGAFNARERTFLGCPLPIFCCGGIIDYFFFWKTLNLAVY